MIAKIAAVLSLLAVAHAGLIGSGLGYNGLGYASGLGYGYGSLGYGYGYGYPSYGYTSPVVSYAPAVSSVSRYDIHTATAPVVKSYVAPVAGYSYASPYYPNLYKGYGYGGYGYGGHGYGYGSKYLWY